MGERLPIPYRGASNTTAFIDTPGDLNPHGLVRNFRVFNPGTDRAQGSMRPVLRRKVNGKLGKGGVQALVSVNRPSISTGFQAGDYTEFGSGTSQDNGTLLGNAWLADPVPSLEWRHNLEADVAVSSPAPQVNAVAASIDGAKIIVAGSALGGASYKKLKVRALDAVTGATLWTYTKYDGARDWYVTGVAVNRDWVFICTREWVYVLWLSGTYAGQLAYSTNLFGWADVTISAGVHTDSASGNDELTVAFYGSSAAGTVVGGTVVSGGAMTTAIEAGITASHYRSGLARFTIVAAPTSPSAAAFTALTRDTFGVQLAATDPRYESNHRYFRLSEQSLATPHGGYITDMAVGADGSVVCVRANQGWGPTTLWRPNGITRPPLTVFKVNDNGTVAWEIDTGGILGTGAGSGWDGITPHYNDILDPSWLSVCVDANGAAYIGGKKSDGGFSVMRISTLGSIDWAINVMDATGRAVRKEAMAIDPGDGNLVVGGDRNTGWTGAAGANANLWRVDSATGVILKSYDLGKAVSVLAAVVTTEAKIAFGTDYVS